MIFFEKLVVDRDLVLWMYIICRIMRIFFYKYVLIEWNNSSKIIRFYNDCIRRLSAIKTAVPSYTPSIESGG